MAEFLSSDLYYSIFKRHVERKILKEINMNGKYREKTILNFNQSECAENLKNEICQNPVVVQQSSIGSLQVSQEQVQNNNTEDFFSLRNDSPKIDLDSSFESLNVNDVEGKMHQRQLFCDWFISRIKEKANVKEMVDRLLSINELSVIVKNKEQLILMSRNDFDSVINLTWKNCWAVIYILCHSDCSVCVFASKPLIIGMLESCEIDLCMKNADLYRVVAYLVDCSHPIIDLQLASRFVYSDKFCHSPAELMKLIIHTKDSIIRKCESLVLFDICDELTNQLISRDSLDVYLFLLCTTNVVLAGLEYFGIDIDKDKCNQFQTHVTSDLEALEIQAVEIAGSKLCLTNPSHLREIIYSRLKLQDNLSEDQCNKLGIVNLIQTRSTNELILSKLSAFHSLPGLVVKYRHMSKTKSIYVDSFSSFIDLNKKKISGIWDQNSSVTGRIFCSKPNLQAFPRDTCEDLSLNDLSLNVKSIFLSSNQYTYVSADFSQIELRLFAHFSNDKHLMQLFHSTDEKKEDLFTIMTNILGMNQLVDCDARQITKKIIYACLYGIGTKGLTELISVSTDQAKSMINMVKDNLPSLETFSTDCLRIVENTNYLVTILGRRRYFSVDSNCSLTQKLQLKRQMMSYVIQGSAADICKIAMINCQRWIGYKCIDAKLILSRHDELVWRVNNEDLIEMIDIIYKEMNVSSLQFHRGSHIESIELRVPMRVKVKKGPSLIEMEFIEHLTE